MKIKKITTVLVIIALFIGGVLLLNNRQRNQSSIPSTTSATVQFVNSTITADGSVVAQNQAKLNFQTGGKLVRLPFKEGDRVRAGQLIAQLDTYALQRQLTLALNNYRIARNSFDQTQQNSSDNVLKSQVAPSYTKTNVDFDSTVNDALKRILDQSQASLDNSVVNVELANYALQLSTLTSPINGTIIHQDVNVAGVNITPATTFVVADPNTMAFRANIPASNIYYVTPGSQVTLIIDGIQDKIEGKVDKVYPSKITLNNGQSVYQVDIVSDNLKKLGKFDQVGRAIINTNSEDVALIPAWVVLSNQFVWINNNNSYELKQITTGKIHGDQIEVLSGLNQGDKIIIDPKIISAQKYKHL